MGRAGGQAGGKRFEVCLLPSKVEWQLTADWLTQDYLESHKLVLKEDGSGFVSKLGGNEEQEEMLDMKKLSLEEPKGEEMEVGEIGEDANGGPDVIVEKVEVEGMEMHEEEKEAADGEEPKKDQERNSVKKTRRGKRPKKARRNQALVLILRIHITKFFFTLHSRNIRQTEAKKTARVQNRRPGSLRRRQLPSHPRPTCRSTRSTGKSLVIIIIISTFIIIVN